MANIKLARYRNTPYIVNFETNGNMKSYSWSGSKGKKYDVTEVSEKCYELDGKQYKSLSAVARAITGTRWNGKLFFGVTR